MRGARIRFMAGAHESAGGGGTADASYLAAIVESSDDAIIAKLLDGTIVSWNAAAAKLYGYSAREAVGRNVAIIVPPERRRRARGAPGARRARFAGAPSPRRAPP